MGNFDMKIRITARRRQSHIVAICLLLTLTLLQELEGKSIQSQQKHQYFQQQQQNVQHSSQQQSYYQNQQQQHQQLQQQNKNPYGNIFGSASTTTKATTTTSRPNSIPNVNNLIQQKIPSKPTRHPQLQPPEDNVVDRYNIRYPDGSYEFRYELADGTARYERGYFVRLDKWKKTLVVVGYYAYRLTDGRYLTVFYNADQFGYRQNQSITPQTYPNLPRSIDVPQLRDEPEEHPARMTTSDSNHIGGTQGNHF